MIEARPEAPLAETRARARTIVGAAARMAALMDRTLETTRLETGQFAFDFRLVDLAALAAGGGRAPPPGPGPPARPRRSRRAAALLGRRRADRGGGRQPPLERREVLAGRGRGPARGAAGAGDGGGQRERPRPGHRPEDQGRLFRPFSRLHDRKRPASRGSGSASPSASASCAPTAGASTVRSTPGEGSTFSFTLPLFGVVAQARAPVVVVAARRRHPARGPAGRRGPRASPSTRPPTGSRRWSRRRALLPVALVLDRVLPRLAPSEVAERLAGAGGHAGRAAPPRWRGRGPRAAGSLFQGVPAAAARP
jgi:hypothetical protein